nr:hypothetical protein CFP56_52556 [Quercus suber]
MLAKALLHTVVLAAMSILAIVLIYAFLLFCVLSERDRGLLPIALETPVLHVHLRTCLLLPISCLDPDSHLHYALYIVRLVTGSHDLSGEDEVQESQMFSLPLSVAILDV